MAARTYYLNEVDEGGYADFERVHLVDDDGVVEGVAPPLDVPALVPEDQEEAGEQLHNLGHQHRRRVEEQVAWG